MRVSSTVYLISISAIISCTVLGFLIGSQKQTFENAISSTVIVLVVSVPLAMEVVTTSTMAIGSRLLSSEGAIVARLGSIEELAGMNMLCSDKTGTLTLNKMAIQDEMPCLCAGLTQAHVLHYAALATKWKEPAKDAIDTLTLTATDVSQLDVFEQLEFEPFDPRVKRNEAMLRDTRNGEVFKVTKGAPHVVAALLPTEDEATRAAVEEATARLAQRGIRTLGVARTDSGVAERWRLLGLLTFLDPPRPDTKVTLEKAATLGVGCKMVTGDNQLIAKETARVLGLGTNILNAVGLPSLDEHGKPPPDFVRYVPDIISADGFAQVFPEHKFLIVEAFRRAGFSVAMTGDGVNDAPALKRADIGIAVQGATDAARASADIVLTQPGLSTIITAIVSARRICRRIKSFVIYRVACTLQILCFLYIAIVAFQPSSYSTGQRSAKSINIPLAVFGSGGKPGGVVVMWAHSSCPMRTPLDLTAMAQGLGQYATNISAASILEFGKQRHSAEWYFSRHPGITVDAGANTVSGPICVEQVPRVFTLPLLALIIITVLNDGTIIRCGPTRRVSEPPGILAAAR
jgi:H+-transporting ATPase